MSAEHVGAVVVGSGFGGAVSAYRLAEAGLSVVVLERGKPYPPGSFARTPARMSRNFWNPDGGLHGLFDVWSFSGLDAVVSSGLGGGSLIYANVLLRKDEHWFVHESPLPGGGYEHWPLSRAELDPHYDAVERMLGATPYPYPDTTAKTRAMREAADLLGLHWLRPPLAVTFGDGPGGTVPPAEYSNVHGLPRATCRLCGECNLGCNDGAKNSLDHTYLSASRHHGADLRTLHEVQGFRPRAEGGFEVSYVIHDIDSERPATRIDELPRHTITCDRLLLCAGALSTTYLLLRNRGAFPGMSHTLGTRFSGNGDLLGFLVNATTGGVRHRSIEGSRGTVITSAIRVGDTADGDGSAGRGYYLEDAGYPVFAEWLAEGLQVSSNVRRAARFVTSRLSDRLNGTAEPRLSGSIAELLGPGTFGDGSLPLLGMGRDVPDGVMRLRGGRLKIDWPSATSETYFAQVRSTMRAIADVLGGRFAENPLWRSRRAVTVHPVGGAPMGRHPGEGIADAHGEVFGFPGLYVLDGAVLPGSVGANPSMTIAAVADRACDRMLQEADRPSAGNRKVSRV